jgi:hypothetical protein
MESPEISSPPELFDSGIDADVPDGIAVAVQQQQCHQPALQGEIDVGARIAEQRRDTLRAGGDNVLRLLALS